MQQVDLNIPRKMQQVNEIPSVKHAEDQPQMQNNSRRDPQT